jgi:hypothetical protein
MAVMIRYTLIVLAILGTAATAIAAVGPHTMKPAAGSHSNVTVIQKSSPFPVLGPIVVEECAVEDCSDTQS